jgi:eukaryotic-like serine/threonine-protein kinase
MNAPAPRILIVDDDVWNAKLVATILEKAGYRTVHAPDPTGALPLIRRERFELVLLDQNMPGMDGLTLLGEVRKESDVPVIMLTSADRSDLAVRAIRLGAYDYLTKPVDERRLLETVPQAIDAGLAGGSEPNRIAHYDIEREVGRGGMGVVYAARDRRLNRSVALKVLLPELASDPEYEASFRSEARSAAQFTHPNIVTVYDAGRYRGRLYISMELVQGQSLQAIIQTGPPLPLRRVLVVGMQIASALEAVHSAGMVHHDLKPGNVMITAHSAVKLLDFGLVRPAPAGNQEGSGFFSSTASGTLAYVAPELLRTGRSDIRTDMYGLGIVLYEVLTSGRAFLGVTQFELMNNIVAGRVTKPWAELAALPPDVVAVVHRMMSLKPEERYSSMQEAHSAIQKVLDSIPR